MAGPFSITRFVSAVMLLDIVLLALVSFSGTQADVVLARLLPGDFGPGMGAEMTGNRLLGALIVLFNAVLFLGAGFAVLLRVLRAMAEEQASSLRAIRTGRSLVGIGAVLLLLAFPALCLTYAQADAKGAPLLRDANGPVANAALTVTDAALFGADQVLDAVLLDIPRVYDWHVSPLRAGQEQAWLRPAVLAFHILAKLIVLALLYAAWRGARLRAHALALAVPAAVPTVVAMRDAPSAANDHHPPLPDVAAQSVAEEPQPVALSEVQPAQAHSPEFRLEPEAEQTPLSEPEPAVAAIAEPEPETPAPPPEDVEEPPTAEARPRLVLVHSDVEASTPATDTAPDHSTDEHPQPLHVTLAGAPAEPAHTEIPPVDDNLLDAPLALHELRSPDEVVSPAADNHEAFDENRSQPYKKTALHVLPEFDA